MACRGTIAVIRLYECTLNDARSPRKVTFVAPVNAVPVIVTDVLGRSERWREAADAWLDDGLR